MKPEVKKIIERDEANRERINALIDTYKMAYKVTDSDGNTFVWAGIESGYPVYRGRGGSKHIFDLNGYTVVEKYAREDK